MFDAAANASRIGNAALFVLTLLIALAWYLVPAKATALRRCHLRPPLACSARARSSIRHGLRCG